MCLDNFFQKKYHKTCTVHKNELILQSQKTETVAWMSGLVTGLQNRAQRFESASDLSNRTSHNFYGVFFYILTELDLKRLLINIINL